MNTARPRGIARVLKACAAPVLALPLVALPAAGLAQQAGAPADLDVNDRLLGLVEPIKAAKPLRLGVTVVHLMDNFYTGIIYGISDEARRSGVEVAQVSVAGNYGDVQQQFAQLEAFRSLGVDYAVLAPAAYSGYDNVLASLAKSGIETLSVGIPTGSKNIAFGVLQDDAEIGRALGEALCADKPQGKKVLQVPGAPGLEWSRLRVEAFQAVAQACGAVLEPAAYKGEMTLQDGLTQTYDQLLRVPDAEYVFTPVSYLGMGAAQAVRQTGRKVKVLTATMVKEEQAMIEDGRMLAVASEPGIIMGRLIVQYAIRANEGLPMPPLAEPTESVPYPHFNVPNVLITKENVGTHPYDVFEYPPQDWKVGATP
ncbi:sugar ABC transporter substrate-binding protein [Verticiella sediminum]|uniref:Sugar ABC transporter substrate-binding protein n=1 Tax=Verticiella sediminum TaxID=1247510 RepID=A0A556AWN8_9BURK|nr:substrate-binding domain-containing protein [Verticiella sediminum]TSH97340.1 sugar ABC transporter substrate-binding protein [Verticiella sediminum]